MESFTFSSDFMTGLFEFDKAGNLKKDAGSGTLGIDAPGTRMDGDKIVGWRQLAWRHNLSALPDGNVWLMKVFLRTLAGPRS